MRNLLFEASFDGSGFHGWQQQASERTVQETIRNSVKMLTGEDVSVTGCSRTDAGVHANRYFFNFKTESSVPSSRFPQALMTKLPPDLVITDCREVKENFNARFDCIKKEYKYVICNDKVLSPFLYKKSFWYKYPLDEVLLNKAANEFTGTYDFSSFCASGAQVKSKVRTVFSSSVERKDKLVIFTVCGDGFLYNMVRIMAGTLIAVNEKKISSDEIKYIINSKDRTKAGATLPPDGLYLNNVYFGGDIFAET